MPCRHDSDVHPRTVRGGEQAQRAPPWWTPFNWRCSTAINRDCTLNSCSRSVLFYVSFLLRPTFAPLFAPTASLKSHATLVGTTMPFVNITWLPKACRNAAVRKEVADAVLKAMCAVKGADVRHTGSPLAL